MQNNMPSKKRGGLSKREYKRKMQIKAIKNNILRSGFDNGRPIDYGKKKYRGYTISSLD